MHPTFAYFSLSLVVPKDLLWLCAALISWHLISVHSLHCRPQVSLECKVSSMNDTKISNSARPSFQGLRSVFTGKIIKLNFSRSLPKSAPQLRSSPHVLYPLNDSGFLDLGKFWHLSKIIPQHFSQKKALNLRSFLCSAPPLTDWWAGAPQLS